MKKNFYSLFFILLFSGSAAAQLTGERTVPSDNYPNLQTVADSLNLYGVGSGGISFMLQGDASFEESPITFTATGNADDPIYIGWDGTGVKPHVNFEGTESASDAGFTLNGVDFYTIDGIKITNSNSNLEFGVLITNFDDQNGAHNNTVKNLEITLDKLNENQTSGIVVNAQITPVDFDGNNHDNKFYNNSISNATIGYSFDGGTNETPLMSVGNEVGIQGAGQSIIFDVVLAGVTAKDQNGFTFSNNIIRDVTRIGDGNTAPAAIATSSGNPTEDLTNEFIISNNTIEDMTSSFTSIFGMYISGRKATYHINNNKIHNVTATGGENNTADGIMVLASGVDVNIYNNMISGIAAPASSVTGNNVVTRGIAVRTYNSANILYNTIVLDYTATNPTNRSAAISIFHNTDPVLMRNNIFINKTILPEGSEGTVAAIHKKNNTLIGIVDGTDNNIYYAGEPGPKNLIFYGFHASSPLIFETLQDYQTAALTVDQNSYTEDVPFTDSSDLHILASATTVAQNNATPVNDPIVITTDYDGNIRDTQTPDIGADEIGGAIGGPLTGVRTVPSDDYATLQIIADSLNLYGVGPGGVSFMLQGGSVFEESPIEFTATGNADNPIYIGWDGVGAKPHVNFNGTDSINDAGLTLMGVDYYTIDGIKITNSNSNLEFGILITNSDDENGSHYNTVKNVEIILDKLNENLTVGIGVMAEFVPVVLDGNNNYNKFYSNNISNVMVGYNFNGNTNDTFLMSVGNEVDIEDEGESIIHDLALFGLYIKDQHGFNVSNTTIRDMTHLGVGGGDFMGIYTVSGNPTEDLTNEFIIFNNTVENLTSSYSSTYAMHFRARKTTYHISNNKIHNITATAENGGAGNTADGIIVLATSVVVNIYNNMVSGIAAPSSALNGNPASRGITVRTYDQANIFYNTVLLDYTAIHPQNHSAALVLFDNSKPVQMRNNIFINRTQLPTDTVGIVAAIYKRNNTWTGIMEGTDNNIYYAGEPGPQHVIYYGHNNTSPNVQITLEDYKTALDSLEQNSYTEDVQFVAEDDLHIVASANTMARNNALPITAPIAITTDFDGSIRDAQTPDIGADEMVSYNTPLLAINPNPENGEIDVAVDLFELSWEYLTSPEYALPEAFLVYLSDSPDFEGATPFATVMWEDGETNYSTGNLALDAATDYYWKVVPTTAIVDGETPAGVVVWTFKTEVYPYPNPAENPTPEDGGTVQITTDHVVTLAWDYNPSSTHSLPTKFELYGASDTNNVAWQTPIVVINYVEGQVAYEIEITEISNFTYELAADNFWKIVPVSASNDATPDVPVWTFSFDNTIGLDNASLEGTLIYPNPAVDVLNIEPGFEGKYEVMLYDIQGRLVQHFGEIEGRRTINISSVQSGAYQLVIRQGDARFTSLIKVN